MMQRQGTITKSPRQESGYWSLFGRGLWSILEGLAVTFSYFRRPPTTVQYPDRTPEPVVDMLPQRFRGLLEVDVHACTGCQACERQCPIDVIRVRVKKDGETRFLEQFDIDLGKCMYCGFCVEACPVDVQSPGDDEITHAIRFTREFEGATSDISTLMYRYIRPGDRVPVAKIKKGQILESPARGERLREARKLAALQNPVALKACRSGAAVSDDARPHPNTLTEHEAAQTTSMLASSASSSTLTTPDAS